MPPEARDERPRLTMQYLREEIFRITQEEMAEIANTSQTRVSRWERGDGSPNLTEIALIRQAAQDRHLPWDDSWVFEFESPTPQKEKTESR